MEFIFLFLGWGLGILSIFITESIRKKIKSKETIKSIRVELRHLRFNIALLSFAMNSKLGILSKEILLWMKPIIQFYDGPIGEDGLKEVFLKLCQNDESIIRQYSQSDKNDQIRAGIKKYSLPYFESRADSLSLLSENLQLQLFDIKSRLEIINQDVDRYWYYFEKTFDSNLSELNYKIINGNIEKQYQTIANQSRILVDAISKVL